MKFNIELTWSKIMALIITIELAFLVYVTKDVSVFTFSIPFIVTLIVGKQVVDGINPKK